MYNLDAKIGMQPKGDEIRIFDFAVDVNIKQIPFSMGRRDYIKIYNNSAEDVLLLSKEDATDNESILLKSNGGFFEDAISTPLFVKSTGATVTINVYERKTR